MPALSDETLTSLHSILSAANAEVAARYPTLAGQRQPVHTVYGGANLFKRDLAAKLGKVARNNLDAYGMEDPDKLAESVGLIARGERARTIVERVRAKLESEPVEDFRIDFEDGYGNRSDEEEDGHARQAAEETAAGMEAATLPPFLGIRIKPLSPELSKRAFRTLDLYLSTLVEKARGLPQNFVVTLPKINTVGHIEALCRAFDAIEESLRLDAGSLKLEMMVETPQSIIGHDGRCSLPAYADAAGGRLRGAHFGTYDYTAECGITAAYQTHTHSACDFARHHMQVAFAGTRVMISDGATTTMPVPVHRAKKDGPKLTDEQKADNLRSVHDGWRLHVANVRHSLAHAIYQGWDLHPAQLVMRYATLYDFFLDGLPAATERLKNFVGQAAQATLSGDMFDDAATGQGLLNFFLLGSSCGAFPETEVENAGLSVDELRTRSFVQIVRGRGHG